MSLRFREYRPAEVEELRRLIEGYRAAIPDAKLVSAEFYTYHPAFEGGRNVGVAVQDERAIVGFAPLSPVPAEESAPPDDPHSLWAIVVAEPGHPEGDRIRAGLLERLLAKATAAAQAFPPGRRVRLACDMMASQRADIDFLLAHGFEAYGGMHVMTRDLTAPVAEVPLAPGLTLQSLRLLEAAEREQYVAVRNRAFPGAPQTAAGVEFLVQSPVWSEGQVLAAVDAEGRMAAGVMVYWQPGSAQGTVDDVFVLPAWRRQGVARHLIAKALLYLRERGLSTALLEVLRENAAAVALYRTMGYAIANEELFLGRTIA